MKTLKVRRHSLTKKGAARERGSLLSADGVRRARSLGKELPAFEYVLTGPDRRHVETAIAMGYAVDEMVEWSSGYVPGIVEHHDQWRWEYPYVRYAELLRTSPALREVLDDECDPAVGRTSVGDRIVAGLVVVGNVTFTDRPAGSDRSAFTGTLDQIADDIHPVDEAGAAELIVDLNLQDSFTSTGQMLETAVQIRERTVAS